MRDADRWYSLSVVRTSKRNLIVVKKLFFFGNREKMRPPAQFPQEIATEADDQPDPRMVGMMICTRLAGRAVIRVVGRCNEAKENEQLGEWKFK